MNETAVSVLQLQRPPSWRSYKAMESKEQDQSLVRRPTRRAWVAIAVLCYLNLVNYMDWFVVAGVLLQIQKFFALEDSQAGFLHTVFILCFLVLAPVFGYLGDHYNRKVILGFGIGLWSGVTLGSSFIPKSMIWLFFLSRGLVGVGTASYSTIAPTIIADLFEKDYRTWVLSLFYIFIPAGSGLGYILSSEMARATGDWTWGFRVTPCMAIVGLVLLCLFVPISEHPGEKEAKAETNGGISAWFKDLSTLGKNWSFLWSSLGVTSMAFITGALGIWMPVFFYRAQVVLRLVEPCEQGTCNSSNSLIFGVMTIVTGILGGVTGAEMARRCKKINPTADPLICAFGSLSSAPCLYLSIMLAQESILATYIFIVLGEFLLSLNWAVVTDILLYVVKPNQQSTAVSLQIFFSHLLGDAGSPYLIGTISTMIQNRMEKSPALSNFRGLQYSFVVCVFVSVLGGACFLLTALRIEEDRLKAAPGTVQGIENKNYNPSEDQQGERPQV